MLFTILLYLQALCHVIRGDFLYQGRDSLPGTGPRSLVSSKDVRALKFNVPGHWSVDVDTNDFWVAEDAELQKHSSLGEDDDNAEGRKTMMKMMQLSVATNYPDA